VFSAWYRKESRRNAEMDSPAKYLSLHCETFVRRITRHVNWCIEKALLIVQFAAQWGALRRKLSLWEVITHSDSLANFLNLCRMTFFDVGVYRGRKYMPRNATEFHYARYREIQLYFYTAQDLGDPVDPGPQTYPVRAEEIKRVQAFRQLLDAYRTQPSSIPADLGDALRQRLVVKTEAKEEEKDDDGGFASLVKQEEEEQKPEHHHAVIDRPGASAKLSEVAVDRLLSLTSDADLEKGLPKTGYFIRLLRQATGTTGESTYIDDLDTEEVGNLAVLDIQSLTPRLMAVILCVSDLAR